MDISRILVALGLLLLVAGIVWPLLPRLGLGRLPGDVVIERGNFSIYVPLVTCAVISLVLSVVFWLMQR